MDWSRIPSLASLRAFEAAARLQSFSAAARELNVTHAAISQQVRGLERDLGLQLLQREGRKMRTLPAAADLSGTLTDTFQRIADAVEALNAATASRPLNVTMTPSFATHWFMPRFSKFLASHSDIDIVINPTGAVVDMTDGLCDIAIRFGDGDWPGLDAEMLLPARHVIVGAPSLLGPQPPADAGALARYRWLEEEGSDEVNRWMRTQGLDTTARGAVTRMPGNLVLPALLDGAGIAATAEPFVRTYLDNGRLVILCEAADATSGYFIVTRGGRMRRAVGEFIRWLKTA